MKDKYVIFSVLIAAVLVAGGYIFLFPKSSFPDGNTDTPEVVGVFSSLYLSEENFVAETKGLSEVRLYAKSAHSTTTRDIFFGKMTLAKSFDNRQTWVLPIPEPELVTEIYALGVDTNNNLLPKFPFPVSGISNIYSAVWVEVPEEIIVLSPGKSVIYKNTKITLSKILEDSRCPKEVQCIQAGRVAAEFVIGSKTVVLSSTEPELYVEPYFFKIAQVEPPASLTPIPPLKYSITLAVITDSKQ